jgi:YlaH-like protein
MAALNEWYLHHPYITLIIIFLCVSYVFNKVFRVQQKLTVGKTILVYVLIAIGSVMLEFFQIAGRLPIILCLCVAIVLMFMVRIRHFIEDRQKRRSSQS